MKNSRLRQNEKGIWRNQKIFIKPGQKNSGKNRKEVMQTTALEYDAWCHPLTI